jgi:hypothetical protein
MRHISVPWFSFAVVELIAVASWFLWPQFTSSQVGSILWGAQLVLLMPGSIAGELAEGLLWGRASLLTIGVLTLILSVALNAFLFWVALRLFTQLRAGLRSNTSLERTRER